MKKLLWIVLLVPNVLLGCALKVEHIKEAHPDWPDEVCQAVYEARMCKGMTIEQVECGLGVWFGYVKPWTHGHDVADGTTILSEGVVIKRYTLMTYSNAPGGSFLTCWFVGGRLDRYAATKF